jgi:polysaccharide biosynthesis protein PslG
VLGWTADGSRHLDAGHRVGDDAPTPTLRGDAALQSQPLAPRRAGLRDHRSVADGRPGSPTARSRVIGLVAVLVLLGSLALGPGTAQASATTPPWGFHDFIWWPQQWYPTSPLSTDQVVQASAADGATIDRLVVGWSWVEPQNGVYSWQSVDGQYRAVAAANVRPVVTVYGAPAWATEGGLSCTDCAMRPDPTHYPDWQSFVQTLIQHLSSLDAQYPGFQGAKALEVWNEPNIRRFFYPSPDAAAFVQLLKGARKAATATHFTQPIVSGGLAPITSTVGGQKIATDAYLNQMYKRKFQPYVDGIGIHPYPNGSTSVVAGMNTAAHYGIDTLDAIRRQKGDAHHFWITEVGVSSLACSVPDCSGSHDPLAGVGSDTAQGNAVVDMYRSVATRPVDAFIIFDFEASDPPNTGFSDYGVVDTSGGSIVPKQSFCILGAQIGNGNPGYGC